MEGGWGLGLIRQRSPGRRRGRVDQFLLSSPSRRGVPRCPGSNLSYLPFSRSTALQHPFELKL